jgi:P27 family predicted phage terminase small subunit
MGRRRDSLDVQEAKGFPRKRLSRAERQAARAQEVAALLATAPGETSDPLSPPGLLTDPRCAAALAVWREFAPRLKRVNLFSALDRYSLASYCYYVGEFAEACRDLLENGYTQAVKTVSGDVMIRVSPSAKRRDVAQSYILEYSKRFGLSPLDAYALANAQAGALGGRAPEGDLFDASAKPGEPAPQAEDADLIGSLARLDSLPPNTTPQ